MGHSGIFDFMNGNPALAAAGLIRSFGLVSPSAHSVYVQTRIDRRTGRTETVLKVHIRDDHPQAAQVNPPAIFDGFPVEVEGWPQDPETVLGTSQ